MTSIRVTRRGEQSSCCASESALTMGFEGSRVKIRWVFAPGRTLPSDSFQS